MIAAIDGHAFFEDGLAAIQSFCQVQRQPLKFVQLAADEEISVSQSSALEGSLEQLDAVGLAWIIFECHAALMVSEVERAHNLFPELNV